MDDLDRRITKILQSDARISNAELARRVEKSPSVVLERVRKLEESGVLQGYEARLDPRAAGLGLLAFLFVRSDDPPGDTTTARRLAEMPEVLEVHHVAGEDCYLVKLRARGTEDLARILREQIGAIENVASTRTTIVLETVKECFCVPFDDPDCCAC